VFHKTKVSFIKTVYTMMGNVSFSFTVADSRKPNFTTTKSVAFSVFVISRLVVILGLP